MSLRGRIFTYLLLFSLLLLILLWLMQVVYLDTFYEEVKTTQIESTGDQLAASLESDNLPELVSTLAQKRQICVSIYQVKNPDLFLISSEEIARACVLSDCVIHHLGSANVALFYSYATSQGGIYTERFVRTLFLQENKDEQGKSNSQGGFWNRLTEGREGGLPDSLVYARVEVTENGNTYFILLNSSITPVTATVTTLRMQLIVISIVLFLLALILSSVIARRLSLPIYEINRSARQLAEGNLSQTFSGHGYKEIGELAETLNFTAAELAKSGQLQQEIIANISHDLRTPLTMIGGYAEFMRDFPEENHSESINVIIQETDRLSKLIQEVLDDSRLAAGVEDLHPNYFDFTESLSDLVNHYNVLSDKDGFHIELEAPQQALLFADRQKLMQAVGNLLSNAMAHAGADKRVCVRQLLESGVMRLEVVDHGPGIAPADLPHIWQRYYRADAPQRSNRGSGLGLSIVKGVLDSHQARYGVESELGEGSVFWFELPLDESGEDTSS